MNVRCCSIDLSTLCYKYILYLYFELGGITLAHYELPQDVSLPIFIYHPLSLSLIVSRLLHNNFLIRTSWSVHGVVVWGR
jgi:hypothetical protein